MIQRFCFALALGLVSVLGLAAEEKDKYLLRYKFQKGEELRWEVLQQSVTQASVSGIVKSTESVSKSTKLWRVKDVDAAGVATFEHVVEDVEMKQQLSGHDPVRYNSKTDKKAPDGFADLAQSVGVVLTEARLDPQGNVVSRKNRPAKASAQQEGPMTIPLPKDPVAIGESWSYNHEADLVRQNQTRKKIKLVQKFTLEDVKTGVATIRVANQILTPISDPALEVQVIQRESTGTLKFDVEAGRVLSQQIDADKRVIGFRGDASSMHYLNRFSEKLIPAATRTAALPKK
jgi:hypothetical protein